MKRILSLSILILISTSILAQSKLNSQKGGNCYSLGIPAYMTRTYDLNDVATLQYQNTSKEAYVIVIEDSKDELASLGMKFIDAADFLANFTDDYLIAANDRSISKITNFKENKNDHAQLELTWESDGNNFYMLITVAETETHFYKLLCWTIAENVDVLKQDYLAVARSLKD